MSSAKERMQLAAELVSKGATMLAEPCPKCGGIQVRFRGRVYCTSHEDIGGVVESKVVTVESVQSQLKEVLLVKLNETALALASEKDPARQREYVSLMAGCYELLMKLPEK